MKLATNEDILEVTLITESALKAYVLHRYLVMTFTVYNDIVIPGNVHTW